MTYRRIAYRHIRRKITQEDLSHLLPAKSPLWLPSPITLHYFVKYRLGEEDMEVLMFFNDIPRLIKKNSVQWIDVSIGQTLYHRTHYSTDSRPPTSN